MSSFLVIESENLKVHDRSRQRHLQAKRMASSSPAALAEILGVPVSSRTTSISTSAASSSRPSASLIASPMKPSEASPSTVRLGLTERTTDEVISTSTVSVSDYFRTKMREQMAARNGGRSSTAMPDQNSVPIVEMDPNMDAAGRPQWEEQRLTLCGQRKTSEEHSATHMSVEAPSPFETAKRSKKIRIGKSELPEPISAIDPSKEIPKTLRSADQKVAKKARKEAKQLQKGAAIGKTALSVGHSKAEETRGQRNTDKLAREPAETVVNEVDRPRQGKRKRGDSSNSHHKGKRTA